MALTDKQLFGVTRVLIHSMEVDMEENGRPRLPKVLANPLASESLVETTRRIMAVMIEAQAYLLCSQQTVFPYDVVRDTKKLLLKFNGSFDPTEPKSRPFLLGKAAGLDINKTTSRCPWARYVDFTLHMQWMRGFKVGRAIIT
jgi:hypothetical protein